MFARLPAGHLHAASGVVSLGCVRKGHARHRHPPRDILFQVQLGQPGGGQCARLCLDGRQRIGSISLASLHGKLDRLRRFLCIDHSRCQRVCAHRKIGRHAQQGGFGHRHVRPPACRRRARIGKCLDHRLARGILEHPLNCIGIRRRCDAAILPGTSNHDPARDTLPGAHLLVHFQFRYRQVIAQLCRQQLERLPVVVRRVEHLLVAQQVDMPVADRIFQALLERLDQIPLSLLHLLIAGVHLIIAQDAPLGVFAVEARTHIVARALRIEPILPKVHAAHGGIVIDRRIVADVEEYPRVRKRLHIRINHMPICRDVTIGSEACVCQFLR